MFIKWKNGEKLKDRERKRWIIKCTLCTVSRVWSTNDDTNSTAVVMGRQSDDDELNWKHNKKKSKDFMCGKLWWCDVDSFVFFFILITCAQCVKCKCTKMKCFKLKHPHTSLFQEYIMYVKYTYAGWNYIKRFFFLLFFIFNKGRSKLPCLDTIHS